MPGKSDVKKVLKAFHSKKVSGWLAKNPPTDPEGNILMSGQKAMKKVNWTEFILSYVAAKCPVDVIESGYEDVIEAEKIAGAA